MLKCQYLEEDVLYIPDHHIKDNIRPLLPIMEDIAAQYQKNSKIEISKAAFAQNKINPKQEYESSENLLTLYMINCNKVLLKPDVIEVITRCGASVKHTNSTGCNAFKLYVRYANELDPTILASLVKNKVNINFKNTKTGLTPLLLAALQRRTLIEFESLLNNGADIRAKDPSGANVLMCYLHKSSRKFADLDVIRFFLNNRADINAVDNNGENILMQYLQSRNCEPEVVELLINSRIRVNHVDKQGLNILTTYLCKVDRRQHNVKIFNLLLKSGVNINYLNKHIRAKDYTPFLYAAFYRLDISIFEMLIQNGANPKALDKTGQNVILVYINSTFTQAEMDDATIEYLISLGVQFSSKSKGPNILMNYLSGPVVLPTVVNTLIKAGVDATQVDSDGNNAIDFFFENPENYIDCNPLILAPLLAHGVNYSKSRCFVLFSCNVLVCRDTPMAGIDLLIQSPNATDLPANYNTDREITSVLGDYLNIFCSVYFLATAVAHFKASDRLHVNYVLTCLIDNSCMFADKDIDPYFQTHHSSLESHRRTIRLMKNTTPPQHRNRRYRKHSKKHTRFLTVDAYERIQHSLHSTCTNNDFAFASVLMQKGFNTMGTICSETGTNLLMYVVRWNDVHFIKQIIRFGGDVNAVDNQGMTPLMYLCKYNFNQEVLELLIWHGADPFVKNHDDLTAFDLLFLNENFTSE